MRARDAQYLFIGQQIEFNDGRVSVVQQNDLLHRQIRLRFSDGTIGINRYEDLFLAEIVDPNQGEIGQYGNVS